MPEHLKVDCQQEDRLIRIEEDYKNHKDWRKEVSTMLEDIKIQLATSNERLKSFDAVKAAKSISDIDDHIRDGKFWRGSMVTMAVAILLNVGGSIWWGATVQSNIQRLTGLHPYGTKIEQVSIK